MNYYYTICKRDIGRRYLRLYNRVYNLSSSIGYVLAGDVGKRIYIDPDNQILSMESDEQYKMRIQNNGRI